ncbi:Exonuclease SbcC [[Actinomadura] parvosata subsp. kistnae]|uniref:Nuclease SbcCD subunit C n=1 Tax=[Actinomadura] parvosata subsp. kistnae TaxID=1909395 RepID=A0A1U9ZR98_9ACTN|nr:AAA family ATPase [Nonomuraea sp. ATCC 55076]AQZ60471.1 ATP-binding cassette family protein [Nonomuraea sp. ATCC 55076]SPL90984.1 Exonuclease SbcC [Actinomadura parvosata subsp. kistnae]
MRPHRLTLTAFGSFPGTETVDFDALSQAGLFLVHGPTGAGKTTILDALCFALYGQVPGQRNSARSLRCDHAPPTVGPSVTLEVTIRGRLLRIQRSPAWLRPKLRGSGTTEEKSKVVLSEWQAGDWHGLTTRLDEAGDLVGGLLGMNADQFCQVAMLPQGDFARFLRADGDERSKLLERLFTVKIFTAAEAWLAEHRKLAWREVQGLRQEVDFAVQRVEEAAGDDLPLLLTTTASASAAPATEAPTPDVSDAPAPAPAVPDAPASAAPVSGASAPGGEAAPPALFDLPAVSQDVAEAEAEVPTPENDPLRWAGALLDAARAVVRRADEEHVAAGHELRAARARFERAAALADRQRRHAEALTLRRTLDERADERADLQAILDDAARADRVLPLITAARQRAEAATKARTLAADALARARPLLPSTTSTPHQSQDRGWEPSVAELAALERRRQDEIARLSELLTEEARLSVVRRDLLRVEQELAELVRADEEVAARLAVLPGLIEQAEAGLAEARVDAARIPAVQAVRDAAVHLIEIDRELAGLAVELEALAQREAEVAAADAELPDRLADASAALAEVRAQAAAIPAAAASLDAARAALEATHRREALAAELEAAVAAHQVLVDQAQASRERWLDLRQARLDGMAAELARDLSDGQPCAVCGSEHHPQPASPAPSAPSADDERAAESAHEAASAEREAAERALASLESRHADAVEATGGLDVAVAEERVELAEDEVARLQAVADREPALAAALERVEAERERVRDQSRELAEALAAHRAHHRHLESERTRLATQLAQTTTSGALAILPGAPTTAAADRAAAGVDGDEAALVTPEAVAPEAGEVDGERVLAVVERELRRLEASAGRERTLAGQVDGLRRERQELEERGRQVTARLAAGRTRHEELSGDAGRLSARLDAARGDDATLAARLSRLNDEAELLREALEATQAAVAAREELDRAGRTAEQAAAEAGFGDVREAEAAYRSVAERERKAELLRRLDDEHAAVSGVLADPELVAAAAEPAPDLAAIGAERDELERAYTRLASARDRAEARVRRLEELYGELAERIERWRPAAERHRLAERMAALASGTSNDNQWSMSLSSFVLGERLRQVVAAANERLDHMSGGRYLLRHDLRKTAGSRARAGGGLGLRVADGWTGVDRDPATLSGGESFITSLALALGLADVVTAEAGGAELGTLFVDEGFGTLDEDTLDGVLDILDGLRDGGRAVGIVSHVAELRSRITAQLKVTKTRTGSTLRAVGV